MSKHCQKINRVTISYTNSADGKFEIQRCLHPDTALEKIIDPDLVCPERLDPDPVNIRLVQKP